jgi:molybdopterin converting factor subunit 1
MQITVKLFAILRERSGQTELSLEIPRESPVSSVAEQIAAELPAIRDFLPRVAFAVNREYVSRDAILHDGDELALIPPVSGG